MLESKDTYMTDNYMLTPEIYEEVAKLNAEYENMVKPLLANIEALSETMPISIYNESRAFTDHIARCYIHYNDKEYILEQLNRASRHLNRMIMDCYKELYIIYYIRIEEFKKFVKNVDLSYVDGGRFYPKYKELLYVAEEKKIEAKKCVSYEDDYRKFEESVETYTELDDYIREYLTEVQVVKAKRTGKKVLAFLGWLAATVLGAILGNNNQAILTFFGNLISK